MTVRRSDMAFMGLLLAGLLAAPAPALAQLDRDRPIRIVVAYAAGGAGDTVVRLAGQQIQETGGPTVVVENRPGGGGAIAAEAVKGAAPNGSTLFLSDVTTFAINVTLMSHLSYDPVRDFKAVGPLFSFQSILVVPPSLGVNSVQELIALANKTPAGMLYASQGPGSGAHLLSEMFGKAAGIKLVHIPYSGGGAPAVVDLMAGRVNFYFSSYLTAKGFIDSQQLKVLAVNANARLPVLPDVPTLNEVGNFSSADLQVWWGISAPAGTPDATIGDLNRLFNAAMNSPRIVERVNALGATVTTGTPKEYDELVRHDIARLAPVIRESGASVN